MRPLDALDPSIGRGVVDPPVSGGLTASQLIDLLAAVSERFRIAAMTMATYVPANADGKTLPIAVTAAHTPVLTYNLMVVGMAVSEQADALFHALADPTRRDILAVVLQEAHSVSDLARRYPISFAAVHKNVGALERAGLVTKTRHGREQRVRGDVATLRTAHRLLDDLEALWRGRIDRIEQLLADPTEEAPQCP